MRVAHAGREGRVRPGRGTHMRVKEMRYVANWPEHSSELQILYAIPLEPPPPQSSPVPIQKSVIDACTLSVTSEHAAAPRLGGSNGRALGTVSAAGERIVPSNRTRVLKNQCRDGREEEKGDVENVRHPAVTS